MKIELNNIKEDFINLKNKIYEIGIKEIKFNEN